MNTLPQRTSRINTISLAVLRFAIGFGIGATAVLVTLTGAGCRTARALALDISAIAAAMAENDASPDQNSAYRVVERQAQP
ncbi:MAG: hypothetical protein ABIG68_09785 [Acidobacteriota bacterium]